MGYWVRSENRGGMGSGDCGDTVVLYGSQTLCLLLLMKFEILGCNRSLREESIR